MYLEHLSATVTVQQFCRVQDSTRQELSGGMRAFASVPLFLTTYRSNGDRRKVSMKGIGVLAYQRIGVLV